LRFVSTSLQKRTNELNLLYIYIYNWKQPLSPT
jgi:hypothetical protein